MSEAILSAQHLRKPVGGLGAVEDVSLAVKRGHVHSIIGPNGAGKTTLMNLLSGIFKPTSGTIQYDGQDITDAPLYRRAQLGIGRSFQITNIFPHLSVLENVRLAAQARSSVHYQFLRSRESYGDLLASAREALQTVGLAEMESSTAIT